MSKAANDLLSEIHDMLMIGELKPDAYIGSKLMDRVQDALDSDDFDVTRWQLVPKEPTEDMTDSVMWATHDNTARCIWIDMLSAAPEPEDV